MLYAVTCKCGHTNIGYGSCFYIPITFTVSAATASDAAWKARRIPRVKHHATDAILQVRHIDRFEYQEIWEQNKIDPYLVSKNSNEQKRYLPYEDLVSRLVSEEKSVQFEKRMLSHIFFGKIQLHKPNKFYKYHPQDIRLSKN